MGMKKRIRLDRVELWASRCEAGQLRIHPMKHFDDRYTYVLINDEPNARGVYTLCQPGNTLPVAIVCDWKRYLK